MDALLKGGGTVQSALDSVQTQLQNNLQLQMQYCQYTSTVPPLCWEADIRAAGGRLAPPSPPDFIQGLRIGVEATRGRWREGCSKMYYMASVRSYVFADCQGCYIMLYGA